MAANLAEMVDKALPSGGVVNCEHLHKLLHVVVHNLTEKELKTDFRCSSDGKPAAAQPFDKENLVMIHGKVKDLTKMSEEQRRMLCELEGKLNSLEGEVNKVANAGGSCGKCGKSVAIRDKERVQSAPAGRSASKRSLTKPGSKRSLTKMGRSSNTSYKSHSCLSEAERSGGVFGKGGPGGRPGSSKQKDPTAANLQQVVDSQMKNIHIPELKKWVEAKLKSLPAMDSLPQRIDQLVKDQMNSTVVPDMKKMIEAMIQQTQKEMGGGAGGSGSAFPLCISCQKMSTSQIDSQDCLCVIKRKMKNASKMRLQNE